MSVPGPHPLPGLELSRLPHEEAVAPLLGSGSEVLGPDDPRSTDHDVPWDRRDGRRPVVTGTNRNARVIAHDSGP